MLFGTAAYFTSAVLFRWIRVTEDSQSLSGGDESGLDGIKEGLRFFRRNPTLLGIATSQLMLVIFAFAFQAVSLIYIVRELGLNAGTIGAIAATGSIGTFFGAVMAARITSAIGLGRVMTAGLLLIGLSAILVPLADGPQAIVIAMLVALYIVGDAGNVTYRIGLVSLRLAVTPDRLGGRITSITVVLSRLGLPIGGLLGGVLGELIGVRATLFVGAAGMTASSLWLVYYRVWSIRSVADFPAAPE